MFKKLTFDERLAIAEDCISLGNDYALTAKKHKIGTLTVKKITGRYLSYGKEGLKFYSKKDYVEAGVLPAEIKRNEVLSGDLWKVVFAITFPIFLYQFINVIYSLLDQIMVSNIGTAYVSAVASINQIKHLIASAGSGLASGGSILIAKSYGASEYDKANHYAGVTLALSFILCGIILIMLPFSTAILRLARVPEDLIEISGLYFDLQLIEQLIMIFNDLFIGIQKSRCNTRPIFVTNIVSMGVKIGLNALLIYGFNVTDLGLIEVATIVSQLVIMVTGMFYMFSKRNNIYLSLKKLSLKLKSVIEVLKVSLPLFLGKFIIHFGKVTINAMCTFYGSLTVGALSVSNSLTGLITNPSCAFEDSQSSIVSMNLGNRNMKRCLKVFLISCVYDCVWGILGFLVVRVLCLDDIVSLFALSKANDSVQFITMIKDIFYYDCITIPALVINNLVLGFLYGYGQTFLSTFNNIFRISVRIISLLILQNFTSLGAESVGISMGLSNVTIAVFGLIMLAVFLIKVKVKGHAGMHFSDTEPKMELIDGRIVNKELPVSDSK